MTESRKRSIAKTITFRIIGIIVTLFITYAFLGNVEQSIWFTILLNVTGLLLFYFHERVWNMIPWERT
jgi:uncharacterized membrane protein